MQGTLRLPGNFAIVESSAEAMQMVLEAVERDVSAALEAKGHMVQV